jgi:AcrR family transcriptional regulator
VRVRAQASRQSLVQAAIALWRTNGFDDTSVTDICKAAGVSKALFYVYFSRKEDVLHEAEIFTIQDAHLAAKSIAAGPYELVDMIAATIGTLTQRMRQFPPDLVFEAVLESYRLERLALANGAGDADLSFLFLEPFTQAQRDGKLRPEVEPVRAARIAQTLTSDGIRRWAATGFADQSIAQTLAAEITAVL